MKPLHGRRAILAGWAMAIVGWFAVESPALSVTSVRSASIVALALAATYSIWMAGFVVRRRLQGRLPADGDPLLVSLLEIALGLSVAMAILLAAGLLGFLRPPLAWAALSAALLGPHRAFLGALRARLAGLAGGGIPGLPALVLGGCGLLTLALALAPVTAQDALVYHLAVPARWVEAGRIVRVEGNFFAQFPQNVDLLFALALLLGSPPLAQVFHWLLGAAAVASVAQLARCLRPEGSAWLAAAIFGTIPTVGLIAAWPYVDLGVVFFATLSVCCFLRWNRRRETGWVVLAALLAGLAAGTKYTGGLQGLVVCAGVLLIAGLRERRWRDAVGLAALAAAVTAAVASPWWIRNIVETGNPVFPFCHGIFGGKGWDAERAEVLSLALREWGGSRGVLPTLLLPWRLTMDGHFFEQASFDGVIGCAFLAGLPLLAWGLVLSRAHRVAAFFLAADALFWIATTRQVRFLLPALAIAAALMGASAPELLGARWHRSLLGGALCAALALNVVIVSVYFASHNPLPVALGIESESAYLRRELPGGDYAIFEHIERELPEDSYILFGSLGNPGFLCKRRYYSDAFFENRLLREILAGARDADALWNELETRGFTHLLFRWDCVLDPSGKKSQIPPEDQQKLADFLNRHARLVAQAGGTVLYRLVRDAGPLAAGP